MTKRIGSVEQRGEVERLVHVARAAGAVADEGEAHGRPAEAALRVGGADDVRHHGAEVADHRQRAVLRIAVVDVALARLGRAGGVGEILVEVVDEVAAPDEVAAEAAVGDGDDVDGLVGQQRERDDEALVALAAGDGAADEALAEELEDAVVGRAGGLHPRVGAEQGAGEVGGEVRGPQITPREDGGRFGILHAWPRRWQPAGRRASPLADLPGSGRSRLGFPPVGDAQPPSVSAGFCILESSRLVGVQSKSGREPYRQLAATVITDNAVLADLAAPFEPLRPWCEGVAPQVSAASAAS